MTRIHRLVQAVIAALILAPCAAQALKVTGYYSPRNRERPRRLKTEFIILHTTEGAKKGSLQKIRERGEAHYVIDTAGRVYQIISRDRVAFHAGRSMWNGLTDLDNYSVGIEMIGYHNKDITASQYKSLRALISELQRAYGVPDDRVLTHSMVAYGAPNRWHRKSHRGRKRCGMLFAKRSVRARLGLDSGPLFDPDVRAGRLIVADPYLDSVLYGSAEEQVVAESYFTGEEAMVISKGRSAWDIARDRYNSFGTLYVFPDGRKLRGSEITEWKSIPPGTHVILGQGQRDNEPDGVREFGPNGDTALEVAGSEYNSGTTVYITPGGSVLTGDKISDAELRSLSPGTKVLVGYVSGGRITAERRAYDICGEKWKFPSTLYRFPDGSLRTGDTLDEKSLPKNALVFFRP